MTDTTLNNMTDTADRTHIVRGLESAHLNAHPLMSWRSVAAGLVISFLALGIFLSMGLAFGGLGLSDGTSAQNAGIFTGVWFLVSSLLALAIGSYFAARISRFHMSRLGSAQGLVIAALFFGFFIYQSFMAVGLAGRTIGELTGGASVAIGAGASNMADNSTVNNIVEDAIGELNLRSEPQVVISGVASRLVRGDTNAAKNYLAYQAQISPEEADQKIAALRARVDEQLNNARIVAAKTLQGLGWSLFATLLLGAAASIGGGALGSLANTRRPLTVEQMDTSVASHDFIASPV